MCIGFLSFNWFAVLWHKSNSCIIILCFMHACLVIKCNVTKNKMFQILSAFISIFFFFGCNLVFDLVLFYEFMSVAPRPESQSLLSSGDREYTGTIDLQRYTLSQIFLDFFILYFICTVYPEWSLLPYFCPRPTGAWIINHEYLQYVLYTCHISHLKHCLYTCYTYQVHIH